MDVYRLNIRFDWKGEHITTSKAKHVRNVLYILLYNILGIIDSEIYHTIIGEKQIIKVRRRKIRVKLELHTHTKYSHDSLLNKWFYLLMLKVKKIDIVGITDHNEIKGAQEFKKFLEKFGIKVIVGEEIFSSKGEIIGLFLSEKIEPGMSPRDTMLEIKKQGGLVYIPHPYDEKRYKTVLAEEEIEKNSDLIDIIEIHNGRNIKKSFSEKQLKIANRYNKIKAVGSDAHTFIELGRNYNIIEEFHSREEFLINLQTAIYIKKDCIHISHQITKLVRMFKLIKAGKFYELYRIIYKRYRRNK